jgi:ubiquinone biosynthesis UbiH/UbiF/VisC/COQ6 family hydroxylase
MMSTPSPQPQDRTAAGDVLIVGGGPAGLALAAALDGIGLRSTVLESQGEAALAEAAPDGRDIALTHRGVDILRQLGLWARLPEAAIAPIREARVLDPKAPSILSFDAQGSARDALGYLVPNHLIRRAAHAEAASRAGVRLLCDARVRSVRAGHAGAPGEVVLDDGRRLHARLIVAADSRLSTTRRAFGIGAQMHDFGRTVIVCRLGHSRAHADVAYECFGYGRTLAILPMTGGEVSAVVTAPADDAQALMALAPEAFVATIERQLAEAGARRGEGAPQLGTLRLAGERHAYPLVAVYAHRFACEGAALIGDAAVGMHPVTAHGYNLGLYGVEVLAEVLREARAAGRDIGSRAVLAAFEARHRRASLPIFLGTQLVVRLFTDESAPGKLLRGAVIAGARHLPPLRAAITQQLTGRTGAPWGLPRWGRARA